MKADLDLGVSLYGFTQRFVERDDYGFEEMFRGLNALGIRKFELVGAQMFRSYPIPSDEEIAEVLELAAKYNVEPFSYGGYIDFAKRTDRDLTDEEMLREITYDLMTAHRLGCRYLREPVPARLMPAAAAMAERYQVAIGYEIHAPQRPSDPDVQELLHVFEKLDSPWVGFVPDFGCYIERPNKLSVDRFLGLGAKPENLQYIIDHRWDGSTEAEMTAKMAEMGGGEAEKMAVSEWFGYLSFAPADLDGFRTVLPFARYFHGKFYHIGEDCVETTIPYEKLIRMAVESGFDGTLMIEYEGHTFYLDDAEEQIARHIRMEKRILADLQAENL
ncbi:MAG: sugar phosphate isomerase/epimerase [Lachnospiraceae bacterium]|jgi:sugar phosphate isomerase/epimerase|nr:sugar phosphate isomerase/epimerase [Lachnospiraceae bacterium]